MRILKLGLQAGDVLLVFLHHLFKFNNPADSLQRNAFLRELLNTLKQVNVALRIAPGLSRRTRRLHQPQAVVLAERLRVHPRQLRRYRNHKNRPVGAVG